MPLSFQESQIKIDEFYQSTICHVCKNISSNLKRCSSCKLFAYCSVEHQKMHWKFHKQFCKMMEKMLNDGSRKKHHIFDLENTDRLSFAEWRTLRSSMKFIWEKKLNRELFHSENQAWMFPRVCEICRSSQQDTLEDCAICYSASYCSTDHRIKHSYIHDKFCKELKLCYDINKILFDGLEYPKIDVLDAPEKFPNNINSFIQGYVSLSEGNDYNSVFASEILSPVLTIIFSLTKCLNYPIPSQQKFTVHMIGASTYEESFNWKVFCDVFLTFIHVKELTVVLIGPELKETELLDQNNDKQILNLQCARCLYHDFINSKLYNQPDVIVSYNCGLHEFQDTENDTWGDSVERIMKNSFGVLILTSYTESEAKLDVKRLMPFVGQQTDLILSCQKNKFSSLRPLRDWATENCPVFYTNNYLTVLKKQQKENLR